MMYVITRYSVVPESPRWLSQNGRHEEALEVIKKMAGEDRHSLPPDREILEAMQCIKAKVGIDLLNIYKKLANLQQSFILNCFRPV